MKRLQAFGVAEIVVKNSGPNGALVANSSGRDMVPVPEVVVPIDATAAGDGFNAGYLAARLAGRNPGEAATAAHRLAGQVIRHRGAIAPRQRRCGALASTIRFTYRGNSLNLRDAEAADAATGPMGTHAEANTNRSVWRAVWSST